MNLWQISLIQCLNPSWKLARANITTTIHTVTQINRMSYAENNTEWMNGWMAEWKGKRVVALEVRKWRVRFSNEIVKCVPNAGAKRAHNDNLGTHLARIGGGIASSLLPLRVYLICLTLPTSSTNTRQPTNTKYSFFLSHRWWWFPSWHISPSRQIPFFPCACMCAMPFTCLISQCKRRNRRANETKTGAMMCRRYFYS